MMDIKTCFIKVYPIDCYGSLLPAYIENIVKLLHDADKENCPNMYRLRYTERVLVH